MGVGSQITYQDVLDQVSQYIYSILSSSVPLVHNVDSPGSFHFQGAYSNPNTYTVPTVDDIKSQLDTILGNNGLKATGIITVTYLYKLSNFITLLLSNLSVAPNYTGSSTLRLYTGQLSLPSGAISSDNLNLREVKAPAEIVYSFDVVSSSSSSSSCSCSSSSCCSSYIIYLDVKL